MASSIAVHGGVSMRGDEQDGDAATGIAEAARRGRAVLASGGSALTAVLAAVRCLEDAPQFNAGTGSVLTSDGTVETDASVMWGKDLTAGGVAILSGFKNPVLVAEAVRAETPHVLLAGEGARRFAVGHGFAPVDPASLITPEQRKRWAEEARRRTGAATGHGTVGAVARDAEGHVAAATSTGGLFFKMPGRVGDTPIIGAGTYAADGEGACSCTGKGEAILKVSLAKTAVDLLRSLPAQTAADRAIVELSTRTSSEAGVILVAPSGEIGLAFNTVRMSRAFWTEGMAEPHAAVARPPQ